MPPRRAGAPRLIDWTGERCVPWAPDVQVVYEHFHRYLWARPLTAGRGVLDLGCGEGFGAALLADVAESVTGIDLDERTIEHARLNYAGPGLEFRVASATDLADFPEDSFTAVVAFEIIEHVSDQATLLAEVARVLAPGGVLIASTPDRRAYSEATGNVNPFHARELTADEFAVLLASRFDNVSMFAQRTATGSRIEALDPLVHDGHLAMQIERAGDEWRVAGPASPLYLVAVAAAGPLPDLPTDSTLSDYGLGLMREAEGEAGRARGNAAERARERDEAREAFEAAAAERDRVVEDLIARSRELEERTKAAADAQERMEELRATYARMDQSVTWQTFQRARGRLYGSIGERSVAGRAVSASLRLFGRLTSGGVSTSTALSAVRGFAPVFVPRLAEPVASIVIPVHSGAELTERCLRAIVRNTSTPYEVILVDDAADPDTRALLRAVEGARVIVNERNLNFLHSVNRGAAEARGRFIVLLNNDTEPQPGWLEAMVERAESAPDVGVVAPKLVYPSGVLQEAGGIVWQDGTAWNYGRGHDANAPQYNFAREVDYGSAAALLVRADLWRKLGGFDERFAPGYWEDTDLGFQARAAGQRVMYEPAATVVHVEGASLGTDVEAIDTGKRNQELNRPKFAAKWQDALREQVPQPSPARASLAADRNRGPSVLIVDHRVPTPDRDSGSLRMQHMLRNLLDLGCRVSFLPDNQDPMEPYTSRLQQLGVEVLWGPLDLPAVLSGMGPRLRLAVLSRPYVAARYLHWIREYAPSARVAYDTVDLHYLRERRRALHEGTADRRIADGFQHLELALARASDLTLVVTEEERSQLACLAPEAAINIVPNANEIATDAPGPEGRSGLLFVGGFEHTPNVDAAVHLAKAIMPLVWRELEDVTLTIVGADPPPEVLSLASPGVGVAGWVEDIGPLLRDRRVMVAPLRYGAGMKGKVTQSLAAGLPVVTTTVGAEGLDATDGDELFVADDPTGFASRIVDLCRDDAAWRAMSHAGRALVDRRCSPSIQRAALERVLEATEHVVPLPVA